MSETTTFTLKQMRRRIGKTVPDPDEDEFEAIAEGWSRSPRDPTGVLARFRSLKLRPGYVLRAYQFREGGNGNAIVWAMPHDTPFPEPEFCTTMTDQFLEPPRPPGALDDVMEAVDGDGTPWSYLAASLFAREIAEFGAIWHGVSWGTHRILDEDPLLEASGVRERSHSVDTPRDPASFRWRCRRPQAWPPSVEMRPRSVVVTFHSFSALEVEAIYRHVDQFRRGRYTFRTRSTTVATGSGGFIF